MANPTFNLKNQYGEVSENVIVSDQETGGPAYDGSHTFATLGPVFLRLATTAGSDDQEDPAFLAAMVGIAGGDDLEGEANAVAGVIGFYRGGGTNASHYPSAAVMGIVNADNAQGAVVALLGGDSGQLNAGAAFKAVMKSSDPASGFTYGLDLTQPSADGFDAMRILNAAIRMDSDVCIFSGATAPVNGTTGDNFAGPGSLYIARDTGALYQQTSLITTPVWAILAAGSPLSTSLTGLSAIAGTISASDTILSAFNKVAGNRAAAQVDSVAADVAALVVDFNALLAKLRTANLMLP